MIAWKQGGITSVILGDIDSWKNLIPSLPPEHGGDGLSGHPILPPFRMRIFLPSPSGVSLVDDRSRGIGGGPKNLPHMHRFGITVRLKGWKGDES